VQVVHLLEDVEVEVVPMLGHHPLLLRQHVRQELLVAAANSTNCQITHHEKDLERFEHGQNIYQWFIPVTIFERTVRQELVAATADARSGYCPIVMRQLEIEVWAAC
jgi:hypothetical protein